LRRSNPPDNSSAVAHHLSAGAGAAGSGIGRGRSYSTRDAGESGAATGTRSTYRGPSSLEQPATAPPASNIPMAALVKRFFTGSPPIARARDNANCRTLIGRPRIAL